MRPSWTQVDDCRGLGFGSFARRSISNLLHIRTTTIHAVEVELARSIVWLIEYAGRGEMCLFKQSLDELERLGYLVQPRLFHWPCGLAQTEYSFQPFQPFHYLEKETDAGLSLTTITFIIWDLAGGRVEASLATASTSSAAAQP